MRQIVVDTETTGLEVASGHRIIEVGCVEIIGRHLTGRHFHEYVNPQRDIDQGALQIHGITREFLNDKPVFADIWSDFLEFVEGAELIIHNADFDVEFLNNEMKQMPEDPGSITDYCSIIDSLALARSKHPGQKNNLDALCKRYNVDSSQRELHGALLDAEILADVYLLLTGGQVSLDLDEKRVDSVASSSVDRVRENRSKLKVIRANPDELARHQARLDQIEQEANGVCLWKKLDSIERG